MRWRRSTGHLGRAYDDRASDHRYDVALVGVSHGPTDPVFDRYAEAGVTWWLEHIGDRRAPHFELLDRVSAGPPVVT